MVKEIELIELRRTSMDIKLRQLSALMASRGLCTVDRNVGTVSSSFVIDGPGFGRRCVDNSKIHDIGGLRVRLPRVEDLLIMKAVARRPKDLQDIEGLLAAHRRDLQRPGCPRSEG